MSDLTKQQLRAVEEVLRAKKSKASIAKLYGTSPRSLGRWVEKYTKGKKTAIEKVVNKNKKAKPKTAKKQEKPKQITFFGSEDSITLSDGEKSVMVPADDKRYESVMNHLLKNELQKAWDSADIVSTISKLSHGAVKIDGTSVFVHGFDTKNNMTEKIIDAINSNESEESLKTMMAFLQNLVRQPDERVVDELWAFLKHNSIEVCADGSFIGYKAVSSDYKDKHTRKIDNSVGAVPEMPRKLVDDNKHVSCSTGLHVGSLGYVKGFACSNDRIMKVRVLPEYVVSVPLDYSGEKLRACKYEVIEDVTDKV